MTKITREQLELAALAAGMTPVRMDDDGIGLLVAEQSNPWRPHTDIADAARLAVRLDLWAAVDTTIAFAAQDPDATPSECCHVHHDGTDDDKECAYCEAVTLCAAAIGRRMREGQQ